MAAQDAILRLLLENQKLIGDLGATVQKWVEATRRMAEAADQVTFDEAEKEAEALRAKIEALAVSAVKDLARIDAANKQLSKEFGTSSAAVKKVETAIAQFAAKAERDLDKVAATAKKLQLKEFEKSLKDADRSLADSTKKFDAEIKKTEAALARWSRTAEQEAKKTQAALDRIQLRKLKEEYAQAQRATSELASSAARHFKSMEAAARASGAQIGVGIGGQITALSPRLQSLRAQFDATIAAMRSASDKVTFERLKTSAQSLHAEIQRLGTESSNEIRKIAKAAEDTSKPVANLSSVVGGLQRALGALGIVLSVRSLFNFTVDAVQTGIRVQALEAQLNAAAGSQERYNEILQFSHTQAERLGFDFEVLAQSTARFEAATRLAGISESERLNVLRSTIDVARTLQLSNQRLNNTLLALEQLASKGTVSMEELRRQLGDNVPGAVAILAAELGVTIHQLFRMIEANQVLSSEALPALARGFDKISGPGLAVALETTATAMGQLNKEVLDLKVAFAEGFSEELKRQIRGVTESLEEIEPAAFRAGEGVAKLIDLFAQLGGGLSEQNAVMRETGAESHLLLSILTLLGDEYKDSSGETRKYSDDIKALAENIEQELNKSLRSLTTELTKASAAEEDSAVRARALADASRLLVESIGQAQRAGKLQGDQLLDLVRISGQLSTLYGDDLPGNISTLISSLESLLTAEQQATLAAERHAEAQKAEAEASLDSADAFAKRSVAADEASRALFGDIAVIEKHTQATVDAIRNVIGSGEDLSSFTEAQLGAMRDEIQKLLDQWAKVGVEPTQALAHLAEQLGVTTGVVKEELDEQVKASEAAAKAEEQAAKKRIQALERIGDAFLKLSQQLGKGGGSDGLADLQKQLDALRDEEQELTFGIEADPERLQEVQAEIEKVREQIRNWKDDQVELGEETAKTADIIDEAIRGLIDQLGPLFSKLGADQESAIQSILQNLQSLGLSGVATGDDVASALQQMITVFEAAGVPTEELKSALSELQTGSLDIEQAFKALREELEEGGESMEGAADSAERVKEGTKKAADEVQNLANKVTASVKQIKSELGIAHKELEVIKTDFREIVQLCEEWKRCMLG